LQERLQSDLVSAMKAGEKHRVETLRGLSSDLKYRRIELGGELPAPEAEAVFRKAAKKRREAIEIYQTQDRKDLLEREVAELAIIQSYLPPEMSDADLDGLIAAAISESESATPADVGRVMKQVMPRIKGQASGERVRSRAMSLLQKN
jgi:uncharacterized protein YqeY